MNNKHLELRTFIPTTEFIEDLRTQVEMHFGEMTYLLLNPEDKAAYNREAFKYSKIWLGVTGKRHAEDRDWGGVTELIESPFIPRGSCLPVYKMSSPSFLKESCLFSPTCKCDNFMSDPKLPETPGQTEVMNFLNQLEQAFIKEEKAKEGLITPEEAACAVFIQNQFDKNEATFERPFLETELQEQLVEEPVVQEAKEAKVVKAKEEWNPDTQEWSAIFTRAFSDPDGTPFDKVHQRLKVLEEQVQKAFPPPEEYLKDMIGRIVRSLDEASKKKTKKPRKK